MSNELTQKIIRCFIVGLSFLGLLTVAGMDTREAHQIAMMLGIMVVCGLLLKNIWLTLFLWWSVFLYSFFKFELGMAYVTNIFFGCLLYYLTKLVFKKEHINFFLNGLLWFVFINIAYASIQVVGGDFIFRERFYIMIHEAYKANTHPSGFMGIIQNMGVLMALAVPILASRRSKWAILGSFGLFLPLYLSKASSCVFGAIIGLLFVLWFRLPKRVWLVIVISLVLACGTYFMLVDRPTDGRITMWKKVLHDYVVHPVTGWGLDSFRNVTSYKDFRYAGSISDFDHGKGGFFIEYWDNPHNLIVSLLYEFGIISIFLLGGYLRQCANWFSRAIKDSNTIGLAGFILVFLIISQGHFPIFLAKFAVIIIPCFALFEVSVKE